MSSAWKSFHNVRFKIKSNNFLNTQILIDDIYLRKKAGIPDHEQLLLEIGEQFLQEALQYDFP